MDITELNISGNAIFTLLLLTFLLFIIFRFINYLFRVFKNKSSLLKSFSPYVPIIEMFAWIIFLIWAANFFLIKNRILAIGVLIVLIFILFWISIYAIKNIIAGALFKFQGNYLIGDYLQKKDYIGKIQKFAFFSLHIVTKDGQSVFVPYSKLLNEVNVRYDSETSKAGYHFKIITSKDESPDNKIEKIKLVLLNMPWVSTKKIPQIKHVDSDDLYFTFEIVLFTVNNKYALKTENLIREKFGTEK